MAFNTTISDCSNDSKLYINTDEDVAEILYSAGESVLSGIIVPCIVVVSFLSNSTFIYTVYRVTELRTITNAYLVNMAVADIIYVEICGTLYHVFPYMVSPLKGNVHYGQIECITRSLVGVTGFYTSFILVTCVAVERYLAICHPLYQHMVSGKSHV